MATLLMEHCPPLPLGGLVFAEGEGAGEHFQRSHGLPQSFVLRNRVKDAPPHEEVEPIYTFKWSH